MAAAFRRDEGTEKMAEQKSQNRDITPLCCGATCQLISTKFVVVVGPTDRVTFTKSDSAMCTGFSRPTGGKTHVALYAAALACNYVQVFRAAT